MAPSKVPAVKLKYANRKSNGTKIAAVVSKDLRKHIVSFDKKQSPSDDDSAALELDIEHKEQNDICMKEFVATLLDAITHRENRPSPLRLEELSLKNNDLTTAALAMLVPVIRAARSDLRDLDLSQNNIKVQTPQEAKEWEQFLQAFEECEVLRRLDLSVNNFSGSLAFEIFLRVYCRNHPVDLDTPYEPGSSITDTVILSEMTNNLDISMRPRIDSNVSDMFQSATSFRKARILKRRRGLRSIPYIILRNCNLDDAGALHLSHVLENHFWPQFLMTRLKEGSKEAKRKEEDDADGVFGVVYHGNSKLTSHGAKLLDYANSARGELNGVERTDGTPDSSWVDPIHAPRTSERVPMTRSRKLSVQSLSDGSGDRRFVPSSPSTDVSTLRMRLQRTTIESATVQGVQLWHAALKVLFFARVVLPQAKVDVRSPVFVSHIDVIPAPAGQPILAITGESSKPVVPTFEDFGKKTPDKRPERRSLLTRSSNGAKSNREENRGSNGIVIDKKVHRDGDKEYRNANNPFGFPTGVWKRIFVEAANAEDILNREQQECIIKYARDRSNIASEQHSQVKGETHQVWKILHTMGCLTYELKMAGE